LYNEGVSGIKLYMSLCVTFGKLNEIPSIGLSIRFEVDGDILKVDGFGGHTGEGSGGHPPEGK